MLFFSLFGCLRLLLLLLLMLVSMHDQCLAH